MRCKITTFHTTKTNFSKKSIQLKYLSQIFFNKLLMADREIKIEQSWKVELIDEFKKPYFDDIRKYLIGIQKQNIQTFPPNHLIFNAFNQTPFDSVRVVIIGQDPYHQVGQAMGLSFSVPKGIKIPASLRNIYAEIKRDLGIEPPNHGDLTNWAKQGVLLLNAILTVESDKAASHSKIGWEKFTDCVIRTLSQKKEKLIFMLWGNFAKSKKDLIDTGKHYILEAVHPSPLAGGKFIGCGHFSKSNEILRSIGESPIDWRVK